jgi:hypothetical protein
MKRRALCTFLLPLVAVACGNDDVAEPAPIAERVCAAAETDVDEFHYVTGAPPIVEVSLTVDCTTHDNADILEPCDTLTLEVTFADQTLWSLSGAAPSPVDLTSTNILSSASFGGVSADTTFSFETTDGSAPLAEGHALTLDLVIPTSKYAVADWPLSIDSADFKECTGADCIWIGAGVADVAANAKLYSLGFPDGGQLGVVEAGDVAGERVRLGLDQVEFHLPDSGGYGEYVCGDGKVHYPTNR